MDEETQNNAEQLEEEFVGLEAIFGNDVRTERGDRPLCEVYPIPTPQLAQQAGFAQVHIPSVEAAPKVVIRFDCSTQYPSREAPRISVIAHHLEADVQQWIQQQLQSLFPPSAASRGWLRRRALSVEIPVMYECIEWLQSHPELYEIDTADDKETKPDPVLVQDADSSQLMKSMKTRVMHGEPFTEKKSTFQAAEPTPPTCLDLDILGASVWGFECRRGRTDDGVSHDTKQNQERHTQHPCLQVTQLHALMPSLSHTAEFSIQRLKDIFKTAMTMERQLLEEDYFTSYRSNSRSSSLSTASQVAKVQNVAVCVSRWYGGIHLGPARFSHINNAARTLLVEFGYISTVTTKKP